MSGADHDYADVNEMFRQLKTLDEGSRQYVRQREGIVTRCLPVAEHIAARFTNRGIPFDDLVQVARMGLVNAMNRFDVDTGFDFLSFAVPTMMGEVRRHFRDHGWAVKVPRRLKDLNAQLNKARDELSQKTGHAPSASELAEHVGLDREMVVDWQIANHNYTTRSMDQPGGHSGDQLSIGETVGSVDPGLEKVLDIQTVKPLIAALPERQRTVLTLRFFEDMTQTQIAEQIGVSQMHVSRLLASALATLRHQACEPEVAASA